MTRYHEYEPHEILRETVSCFWIHEAEYPTPTEQDISPDGCVELIFNFGDPYLLRKKPREIPLPPAVIVGFQDKPIPLRFHGTLKVIAARLYAWGALALVQDNVTMLANALTPLKGWDALVERLRGEVLKGKYEQAVAVLEEHLLQQSLARAFDRKTIQAAAKLLHQSRGQVRIADLADYCRMSVRQLERGFQQLVGTSPKSFARTLRFQQAERRLMFEQEADLTDLAQECGYFDQAHFIKDFKAFTGKTPSEYAEGMRCLQEVLKGEDVVFLQSSSLPEE